MTKKEKIWNNISKQVDHITDDLGMPVDKKIKGVVIGLNANGINTYSSCGGHMTKNRQLFPWVGCQAWNKPKYRFVGEEKIKKNIAKKYKLTNFFWPGNEKAEKEYYESMQKAKETSEYIKWYRKQLLIENIVKNILLVFYASGIHTKGVKLARGDIYAGCLIEVSNKDEKKWRKNLSQSDFKDKITESQKEMKFFANFLKIRFFKEQS